MIVMTGASDGVGLQVAKLYEAAGKKVVNVSRRKCQFAAVNVLHNLREGDEIQQAAQEILELAKNMEVSEVVINRKTTS